MATASLLEVWIDETERRVWFPYETGRKGGFAPRGYRKLDDPEAADFVV